MLSQNDIIKFLKDNRYDLIREYNLSKIGLFGSFARGEQIETLADLYSKIYNKDHELLELTESAIQDLPE